MDLHSAAALLAHADGDQAPLMEQAAGHEPITGEVAQHLLSQAQLVFRNGILLGELRPVILPELFQKRLVRPGQGHILRIGEELAEFIDMVALAAVTAAREVCQVLPAIDIVLPGALTNEPHHRVAEEHPPGLPLRHHGDHRAHSLLGAVFFDEGQGRIHISLRAGNREIKLVTAIYFVANDQAARRLAIGRAQHAAPHELHAHGILAQAVVTIYIVGS